MIHIGIDPGFTGAIVSYDTTHDEWRVMDMPIEQFTTTTRLPSGRFKIRTDFDVYRFVHIIQGYIDELDLVSATIERAQPMSKNGATQGVSSTGRYMEAYGMVLGVLSALAVPYNTIPARTWKRQMEVPADKAEALTLAGDLIPGIRPMLTRVKDHGRAEAGLLCLLNIQSHPEKGI